MELFNKINSGLVGVLLSIIDNLVYNMILFILIMSHINIGTYVVVSL